MARRRKYGNRKISIDGQIFDSKKEGRRYLELCALEKSKEIYDLRRQVKFVLIPAQREPSAAVIRRGPNKGKMKPGRVLEREIAYIADFVYLKSNGEMVVEDTKGIRTTDYILKRKMMLYFYGIRIVEI